MGVKYTCSYCEKKFIGDYGYEDKFTHFCSEQCKKDWQERLEKNMAAYIELTKELRKGEIRDDDPATQESIPSRQNGMDNGKTMDG